MIQDGISSAFEKGRREKRRIKVAKSFGEFGERWLQDARMSLHAERPSEKLHRQ